MVSTRKVSAATFAAMKESLRVAQAESDVAGAYRSVLDRSFKTRKRITSPKKVDGIISAGELVMLLEFKYRKLLATNVRALSKVVVQTVFYIKKIADEGVDKSVPRVVFIGDETTAFLFQTRYVAQYLQLESVDWSKQPSSAGDSEKELMRLIKNNSELWENMLKFTVSELDSFEIIQQSMLAFTGVMSGVPIEVTSENLIPVYNNFVKNVLDEETQPLLWEQRLNVFNLFILGVATLDHNTLIVPSTISGLPTAVSVQGANALAFKNSYGIGRMSAVHSRELGAHLDRIVDDERRRRHGMFYTSRPIVNEVYHHINQSLGAGWQDKYAVWDPASGTGNLTVGRNLPELYSSTIDPAEVSVAKSIAVNFGAHIFQMDFLNTVVGTPEFEATIPEHLKQRLEGTTGSDKRMLFLFNPPFAGATNAKTSRGTGENRAGVASDTAIARIMKSAPDLGVSSSNLYAQFVYHVLLIIERYQLEHAAIVFFSTAKVHTASSQKGLRTAMLNAGMHVQHVLLVESSEFSDTKGTWPVAITILKSDMRRTQQQEVRATVYKSSRKKDGETAMLYPVLQDYLLRQPTESERLSTFVRSKIPDGIALVPDAEAPALSSGLVLNGKGKRRGHRKEASIGDMSTIANDLQNSPTGVALFSASCHRGNSASIMKENCMDVFAGFAARKLAKHTWYNDADEFFAPDATLDEYDAWNANALVFGLFHSSSNQTSLRQVRWDNNVADVFNEFFWMSPERLAGVADAAGVGSVVDDVAFHGKTRYMRTLLGEKIDLLSTAAKEVLAAASTIVELTMPFRHTTATTKSGLDMHLQAWDAGWYQIKKLLLIPEMDQDIKDLYENEFQSLYRRLAEELYDGVYRYGFLKNKPN